VKVHIVTDSAAHFDEPVVPSQLGITVLPLTIKFGPASFEDGVNLSADEFFVRLMEGTHHPTYHSPTIDQFRAIYGNILRSTDQILSIHISSKLGQVISRARTAASDYLGRSKIVVVDSATTSVGLGILVEAAARAAQQGTGLDDIVRMMRGMIPHIYTVFFTRSLDCLEHSGRIGKSQAILGTMLGIKPFLTIEDGQIIPIEKVRTRERAIDKLVEFVSEFVRVERVAVLHGVDTLAEDTQLLLERLSLNCPSYTYPVMRYGPALGCDIGPDGLGIVVYEGMGKEGA
jgi:DegV family protein with EDD domain